MLQVRRDIRGNERGQALLEYAILVATVGACLVAMLGLLGKAAKRAYVETTDAVSTERPPAYHGGSEGGGVMVIDRSSGRHSPRPTADPSDSASTDPRDSVATTTPSK